MADDPVTLPISTDEVVVAALDQFIANLGIDSTGQVAALIEAKRLRHIVANWQAVPPTREVRTAMILRISELVESARGR
jgi:hypothetical protein